MLEKMGFDRLNEDHREGYPLVGTGDTSFFSAMDTTKFIKTALKTHFIKDKNRIFPIEQEITVYIQQQHHGDLFQIQYRRYSIILIF
jgi:hypothetical protein